MLNVDVAPGSSSSVDGVIVILTRPSNVTGTGNAAGVVELRRKFVVAVFILPKL